MLDRPLLAFIFGHLDNGMFQASTLARILFLASMLLARMLACLDTWSLGQFDIPSLRYLLHCLVDCTTLFTRRLLAWIFGRLDNWMNYASTLGLLDIWLPAARHDTFARCDAARSILGRRLAN
jgi:hypothetical protein